MDGTKQYLDGSAFATLDHDLHRVRRGALNPYFSKRMVQRLEPRVKQKVLALKQRLVESAGEVIDIYDGTAALTLGMRDHTSRMRFITLS